MLSITRILLAFMLVSVGLAVACGDDDDDEEATVADSSPSATPCPSPSPTTTAGVTGSPAPTGTVGEDDDDDDDDDDNDDDNSGPGSSNSGRDDDDDDDDDNNLLGEASPTATAASATATTSAGDPCPEDAAGADTGTDVPVGQVSVIDFAFEPGELTVNAGDTVGWQNNGDARHTVTAEDDSFDSGDLEEGQTFEFTFSEAGSYDYRCDIHPEMTGTIIVQ